MRYETWKKKPSREAHKLYFNGIKQHPRELEVRRSKLNASRPTRLYEEVPDWGEECSDKIEDKFFDEFEVFSAEAHANISGLQVTFEEVPVVGEEFSKEMMRKKCVPFQEIHLGRNFIPVATYEQIGWQQRRRSKRR